jgi:hypothetical protein
MHPAGFDADGQMYVDTRFGDFPHWLPSKERQSHDDLFTGWMLLSYRKAVTASSARDSFPASNVTDEDPPIVAGFGGYGNTFPATYDYAGVTYFLGVNIKAF